MTVIVSLLSCPVTKALAYPYETVTVTVRRLRTPEWETAREKALFVLRDDAQLLNLLVEHDLLPPGGVRGWKRLKDQDPAQYASFLAGVAMWLTSVECALAGVIEWSGLALDDGTPAPLDRPTLQALLLNDAISSRLMDVLNEAGRLLVVEGKPLPASPNGSSAAGPTASGQTTATTAAS